MSSTHIGHVWFKEVGIVLAHDPITDKLKAWIRAVPGEVPEEDIKDIMEYGAKFPTAEAISLINNKGQWNLETTKQIAEMTEKQGEW